MFQRTKERNQGSVAKVSTGTRLPAIAIALALLSACGGGGDGGDVTAPPAANASPGGIWKGTESGSGLQVTGLITETGKLHFLRSDGVQYTGDASTSGNSVSASVEGFTEFGTEFSDGAVHGTGSVSGTIQERSSMSLSTQFKTDAGSQTNGTLNLTFNSQYNRPSSLSTIAGNFTNPQNGVVVTVGSDGTVFAQDPATGCVTNGTVSTINTSYNAYNVAFTYASCRGQAAVLNGIQFSGLGTLDNSVSPEQAIIGVTGQSGSTKYAFVLTLNRS